MVKDADIGPRGTIVQLAENATKPAKRTGVKQPKPEVILTPEELRANDIRKRYFVALAEVRDMPAKLFADSMMHVDGVTVGALIDNYHGRYTVAYEIRKTIMDKLQLTETEKLPWEGNTVFSTQASNTLRRVSRYFSLESLSGNSLPGMFELGAISIYTAEDLMQYRNLGKLTVREISAQLARHGLALATSR